MQPSPGLHRCSLRRARQERQARLPAVQLLQVEQPPQGPALLPQEGLQRVQD